MPRAPALQAAFETRADGVSAGGMALVGIFGAGLPEALITARGGRPVDVKAPPLTDAANGPSVATVDRIVEGFMDPFAARFLHRFAAGAFDRFSLIFFARDDAAGLTAYQYAQELRRQRRVGRTGPRLYLWNMIHTVSAAATAFNLTELARLETCLSEVLGTEADDAALETAIAQEARRAAALAALPPGGAEAFVARVAGRWLTPEAHLALLGELDSPEAGPRIALVGTACDIPVMHSLCEGLGTVVADLQEYGRASPAPGATDAAGLMRAAASDPLHIRAMPPGRYSDALRAGIAKADLVIATVDANDDGFGWEIPGLRAATEARGTRFLDLGFRPFRPDDTWYVAARRRIEEALG